MRTRTSLPTTATQWGGKRAGGGGGGGATATPRMGDKGAATAAATAAGRGAPSTPTGTSLTCHEHILQLRPEVEPAVLPVEAEPLLFFLLLYLIERPLDVISLGVRLRT